MIVGEAPGYEEDRAGAPFVGASGHELTKMLQDAGISRDSCYITNAVKVRPPDNAIDEWISNKKKAPHEDDVLCYDRWVRPFIAVDLDELFAEIEAVKPMVIIALGGTALWALTGKEGIAKWRGSQLVTAPDRPLSRSYNVVPAYHPAAILRQWSWRIITVLDLKRAHREVLASNRLRPATVSIIQPDYATVCEYFSLIERHMRHRPTALVIDLEIKRHAILCAGLAIQRGHAVCIPFWHEVTADKLNVAPVTPQDAAQVLLLLDNPGKPVTVRYWPWHQELEIIMRLRAILIHPNCRLVNQNLGFDLQFISCYWHCLPIAYFDTMIAQHVMLPGTPKDLSYLHSIYGDEYVYWKDDGKFWQDNAKLNYPQLWEYNCKDALTTFEIYQKQRKSLANVNLAEQFKFQMRKLNHFAITMFRGVRVNEKLRNAMMLELIQLNDWMRYEVSYLANRDLNPNSPKQLMQFFYTELRQPEVLNSDTKKPSCDEEACKVIGLREPLLEPITSRLNLIRSYGTSMTICKAGASQWTRKWHPSFNTGGTETFRCSSSKNVWKEAFNAQNVTDGKEIGK